MRTTELEEKYNEALEAKKNNLNNFVWKEAKETKNGQVVQKEVKLIEASEADLNRYYKHCMSMLYNEDKVNPGRYVLLEIIKEQIIKCNAELFLRYVENTYEPSDRERYPRFSYMASIKKCISLNNIPKDKLNSISITEISTGVPEEFNSLSIDTVIDGCLDTLGSFNKKHLTLSFILKMGIWFTQQELRDLTERDENGKIKDRLALVKERLGITNVSLRIDSKGLSFAELKAMVQLKSKKYSELTTEQLVVLRNKVLFRFANEVERHANQWEERMEQIRLVAEKRNITLDE